MGEEWGEKRTSGGGGKENRHVIETIILILGRGKDNRLIVPNGPL